MKIFRYLFDKIKCKYEKWDESVYAWLYAICIIALLQLMNLLSILYLIDELFNVSILLISDYSIFISYLMLLYFDYLKLVREPDISSKSYFRSEQRGNKNTSLLSLVYVTSSILLCFAMIIVHRSNR
jgi:hypothetical protein